MDTVIDVVRVSNIFQLEMLRREVELRMRASVPKGETISCEVEQHSIPFPPSFPIPNPLSSSPPSALSHSHFSKFSTLHRQNFLN